MSIDPAPATGSAPVATEVTAPAVGAPAAKPAKAIQPKGARWWREVGWRHVVGLVALLWAIFPILYIISAAFDPLGSVVSTGLLPTQFSTKSFSQLFSTQPYARWFANTMIVCALVTLVQVFFSTMAAFAFSRLRFRGRRGGLLTLLLIQMFPQFLAVVAIFQIFSGIGDVIPALGLDTLAGYILVLLGNSLGQVWLIKGFFDSVPRDLDEAATVDGAGHARIFFTILLPLMRPVLAVTGLLVFVAVINEFLLASIFLRSDQVKTLAPGLFGLIDANRSNNLGVFAAGALLAAVPVIALFQFLQRYIVGGITAGAVKG